MRIVYSRTFEKELKKKTKELRAKAYERERLWAENPRNPLLDDHGLNPPYEGCRSFNVTGDYRIIYTTGQGRVVFLRIGTHHELYGS